MLQCWHWTSSEASINMLKLQLPVIPLSCSDLKSFTYVSTCISHSRALHKSTSKQLHHRNQVKVLTYLGIDHRQSWSQFFWVTTQSDGFRDIIWWRNFDGHSGSGKNFCQPRALRANHIAVLCLLHFHWYCHRLALLYSRNSYICCTNITDEQKKQLLHGTVKLVALTT